MKREVWSIILSFKWVLRKRKTKQSIQQVSLLFKGQKYSQSYLKSEKVLRQTPLYNFENCKIDAVTRVLTDVLAMLPSSGYKTIFEKVKNVIGHVSYVIKRTF